MAAASEGNRRTAVIVLGSTALLVLLLLLAENAFNLKFLSPHNTSSILFFTALSGLCFLLFLTLLVLLFRNILKLYASEKSRVLGSRLRTRMLLGALLLSVAPAFFMLFFNYLLMNRSIDRWFSQPVAQLRNQSMQVALEMSHYAVANARAEAGSLASSPALGGLTVGGTNGEFLDEVHRHRITLQGGFVIVYRDSQPVNQYQAPQATPVIVVPGTSSGDEPVPTPAGASPVDIILQASQRTDEPVLRAGGKEYSLGAASSRDGLVVVVGLPLPPGVAQTMRDIESGTNRYWMLFRARRIVRHTYFLVLLLLTGLTLFVSSWLALFLSKQVTRPVEALADAMDAMASGDYGYRVDVSAGGELGELVRSFNHMATDLETSRTQLEASTQQLSLANTTLDERRRELETVLETIPSGVATLDSELRILQANRAFYEMLDPLGELLIENQPIQALFPPEAASEISRVLRRSRRLPAASTEIETRNSSGPLHLIFTVTQLRGSSPAGHLVVLDNVTEVLRAQKQLAWKEVAQRVAHEIKNPLTPIALSAERIERHLDRGIRDGSAQALRGATEVIRSSVQTLRQLVDQFADLADFPAARPVPMELNTVIETTLGLFAGRLEGIDVQLHLAHNSPFVMADAEALKRAVTNLIDNAAEAMRDSLLRVLTVQTGWNEAQTMAEIVIADTGHGITEDTRERLFLPFFSTRRRGTGLGLSIAAKIVQEHQGNIRAEKNSPAGARFIVEIPLADVPPTPDDEPLSAMPLSDAGEDMR